MNVVSVVRVFAGVAETKVGLLSWYHDIGQNDNRQNDNCENYPFQIDRMTLVRTALGIMIRNIPIILPY
jgi:hypothetical protein